MRHVQAKPFGNAYTSRKFLFVPEENSNTHIEIPNFTIKYMLIQTLIVLLKKIIMENAQLLNKPWQPYSTSIRLLS